jgi:Gpi18-like mannosyltransferase
VSKGIKTSALNKIVLISSLWLVILTTIIVVTNLFFHYRSDFSYTSITHFNQNLPAWSQQLLTPWANFDGVHYLQIGAEGYLDQLRFFPLYPTMISIPTKLFSFVTFGTAQLLSSLLISWLIFGGMVVVWKKLLKLDFSENITQRVLLAALAFPTAFFLISIYSESLFLLLTGLSFWFARKKQWGMAILFASLLSITRLTGIVIWPALLLELWLQANFPKSLASVYFSKQKLAYFGQHQWRTIFSTALIPLPLLGYAYFNFQKMGDWLYFLHAHGNLANGRATSSLVFPVVTLYRYLKILISLAPTQWEFWVAVLELGLLGLVTALLITAWRQKIRWSYLVFATLAVSIPILSGTLSGLPRYSLVAFPIFISISQLENRNLRRAYYLAGFSLQIILLALFSRGYFVA